MSEEIKYEIYHAVNNSLLFSSNNEAHTEVFIEMYSIAYPLVVKGTSNNKLVFEQLLCFDKEKLN